MKALTMKALTMTLGLSILVLGFQNCTKTKFVVDDALKAQALKDNSVFDGGFDPNVPARDTGGTDPTTGSNQTGRDPAIGTNNPGKDNSTGSAVPPKLPPQSDLFANFGLACPMGVVAHGASKALSDVAGDVKLVLAENQNGQEVVVCEVHNVKKQILSSARKVDMSSCKVPNAANGIANLYVVEEGVTGNFASAKLNVQNTMFLAGKASFTYMIAFAEFKDSKYEALCDQQGDPLLIQLGSSQPKPIELTSAHSGVLFDLLGRRNDHKKVQTAWFANASSENYFVVLPNDLGQVLGIDEMFGDNTFGPDQKFSKQGFHALAKYDENADRQIDPEDEVFAKLKLWKDENLDGIAQANELHSLAEKKVRLIDLRFDRRYKEKDQNGNMVKYKSVVVMEDKSYGLAYDLWLAYIPTEDVSP